MIAVLTGTAGLLFCVGDLSARVGCMSGSPSIATDSFLLFRKAQAGRGSLRQPLFIGIPDFGMPFLLLELDEGDYQTLQDVAGVGA